MSKVAGFILSFFLGIVLITWVAHSATRIFHSSLGGGGVGGLLGEKSSPNQLSSINFSFFPNIKKNYISQGYGATSFAITHYNEPWHNGIDIAANYGAPIESATNGIVLITGNQDQFCPGRGYGKFVVVRTADAKNVLLYGHLSEIKVKESDRVQAGTIIGLVGNTGFATGPHLHFTIFAGDSFYMKNQYGCGLTPSGKDIDPTQYLNNL